MYSISCMGVVILRKYDHRPSHPYNAGTKHLGFLPTRRTLLAPSAKPREAFGESHEGVSCILGCERLVRRTWHTDDSFNESGQKSSYLSGFDGWCLTVHSGVRVGMA